MLMGHLVALLFLALCAHLNRKNDGLTTNDQHAHRPFWQYPSSLAKNLFKAAR